MIEHDGVRVSRNDRGFIVVEDVEGQEAVGFTDEQARWLAHTALPGILPPMKTSAEQRDERLSNGR